MWQPCVSRAASTADIALRLISVRALSATLVDTARYVSIHGVAKQA